MLKLAAPVVIDAEQAQFRAEMPRHRRHDLQRPGRLGEEQILHDLRPGG